MPRIVDVVKTIGEGKIPRAYGLYMSHMDEIRDISVNAFELITYAFKFGYAQGVKAVKARIKRKNRPCTANTGAAGR